MKRIISFIMASVMLISLCACGGNKESDTEMSKETFDKLISNVLDYDNVYINGEISVTSTSGSTNNIAAYKLMEAFSLAIPGYTDDAEYVSFIKKDSSGEFDEISIFNTNDTPNSIEAIYNNNIAYIDKEYVISNTKLDNKDQVREQLTSYKYIELAQGENNIADILDIASLIDRDFGDNSTYSKEYIENIVDAGNNQNNSGLSPSSEKRWEYRVAASSDLISSIVENAGYTNDADFSGKSLSYSATIFRDGEEDNIDKRTDTIVSIEASNGDVIVECIISFSDLDEEVTEPHESIVATTDQLIISNEEDVEIEPILGEPDYTGNGFKEYTSDIGFEATVYSNILMPLGRFQDITAVKVAFNDYIKPIKQALINEAVFGDTPNTGSSDEKAELVAEVLDSDIYERYQLACDHVGYQLMSYSLSKEIDGVNIPEDFISYAIERIHNYTGLVIDPALIREMASKCIESGENNYLIRVGTADDRYSVVVSAADVTEEGTNITWSIQGNYQVE